ncbi:MAG: glycogen debranching protein [Angustibacter sp.]
MIEPPADPDRPAQLGVRLRAGGADVAVYAGHADVVQLCLFDGSGPHAAERRIELPYRRHGVHSGFVAGVQAGDRYGFRVHGPWDPGRGLRHNPAKLLLDPYARAIDDPITGLRWRPEAFGHVVGDDLVGDPDVRDDRDSAPFVPRSIVLGTPTNMLMTPTDAATTTPTDAAVGAALTAATNSTVVTGWAGDRAGRPPRPGVPWADTVIYEAHVRGLTQRCPEVPEPLRGTYAGLGHPAITAHLRALGVTTVQLMPVHAFVTEPWLARRGKGNYWGYNTVNFHTPHMGYASTDDPEAVLAEFRTMVDALHTAGLEVLLDVVYNHTCEQGRDGPTLCWRGLDNRGYYRLDTHGRDLDVTGCGNTLNFGHPRVVQLALDSLRYWVQVGGVDGFRFDLATALARGPGGGRRGGHHSHRHHHRGQHHGDQHHGDQHHGDQHGQYRPDHPFLVALRTDPVLSSVKLVAEPWDVGPHGWRTGEFPPPLSEWNDRFRDDLRTFWLTSAAPRSSKQANPGGVQGVATRIAGSQDLFGDGDGGPDGYGPDADRGPVASVNFIAAHDGFTLADCVTYEQRHNEANGEGNRDGHGDNRTWNHGVEGPTADIEVLTERRRSLRNLLGSLMLSTGVPMLTAGDELGRTQDGNNNAYCQDGPISWVDWELTGWQRDLLDTTAHLLRLRREHPVLRQRRFFGGRPHRPDGTADLVWFAEDGTVMVHSQWQDPHRRMLQALFQADHALEADSVATSRSDAQCRSLLLLVHGGGQDARITLPGQPWATGYQLLWDSGAERPGSVGDVSAGPQLVPPRTIRLYAATPGLEC